MAAAIPIMMMAGAAMKFVGAASQGEQEASQMNRAGDIAAANARNTQLQTNAKEETQRRHQALQMGNIRAAAAESGFDASSGSLANLQVKSASEMELDALTTRYEGTLRATNFKNEEAGYRVAAKNARRSGYLNAFGSLAQSGASYFGGAKMAGANACPASQFRSTPHSKRRLATSRRLRSRLDLSGLSNGLSNAADTVMRAQQREDEKRKIELDQVEHEQRKARVVERASNDRLTWTEQLQKRQTEAALGAEGFTPQVLKEFDAYREQATKQITDEKERRMYDGMLVSLRENIGQHAISFESQQRLGYRKNVLADGVATDARTAAIDPTQVPDIIAQRVAAINTSSDLSPVDKQALVKSATETVSYAAAQNVVEQDPAGILRSMADQKAFAEHPFLRFVAPEHIAQLRNHANALVAQSLAKQEHQSDKAMKEAEQATDELRKFWIGGAAPDLAYIATVQAKTKGTPYEAAANSMIQQAQAGAGHGASPVPRQEASIRAIEAKLATGSSPEAEKTLAYARQVTETQRREFKENPWAAAARFQRLPSVPDTPIPTAEAVPDYVAQVVPMMAGIETASGQPASPLQPAQAQKFSEQLKALPPGPRATVLGKVGERLSAPRIAALSEQIDKHDRPLALALKLGSGKTSLDRANAETLLRGADAIKDKTVKRDDAALTGWRSEISSMVRGTLGDKQMEDDIVDAAYYVRAGMDEPGYPGKPGNESAVKLVIGQPMERAGVKTILPKGMDEGAFTDKLRTFTPEKLKEVAPGGEVFIRGQKRTLEQLSSGILSMGMRRDGQGKYLPVSGGAFVTVDPEGQVPLRLEVR